MDFTGLYNAIMQLIFIVTGLVSIKSLTDMITQLVGQGDALKDGADTSKEVAKRIGQTAAVGVAGAGLAIKGAQLGAGVARSVGTAVANSKTADRVRSGAGALRDKVSAKVAPQRSWYRNMERNGIDPELAAMIGVTPPDKGRMEAWVGRRAESMSNRRDRLSNWAGDQRDRVHDWGDRHGVNQAVANARQRAVNAGGWVKNTRVARATSNVAHNIATNAPGAINATVTSAKVNLDQVKKDNAQNWKSFAETGQEFNKLWGSVTGLTGFYKQMESDDAVIGGDNGRIHRFMKSVFKFKNDKEKGIETTEKAAVTYANTFQRMLGHTTQIRGADGQMHTVGGLNTVNLNADNVQLQGQNASNRVNHMHIDGEQKVEVKSMPEVKLKGNTKISLNDAQVNKIIMGMASLSRTEQSIVEKLQDILDNMDS